MNPEQKQAAREEFIERLEAALEREPDANNRDRRNALSRLAMLYEFSDHLDTTGGLEMVAQTRLQLAEISLRPSDELEERSGALTALLLAIERGSERWTIQDALDNHARLLDLLAEPDLPQRVVRNGLSRSAWSGYMYQRIVSKPGPNNLPSLVMDESVTRAEVSATLKTMRRTAELLEARAPEQDREIWLLDMSYDTLLTSQATVQAISRNLTGAAASFSQAITLWVDAGEPEPRVSPVSQVVLFLGAVDPDGGFRQHGHVLTIIDDQLPPGALVTAHVRSIFSMSLDRDNPLIPRFAEPAFARYLAEGDAANGHAQANMGVIAQQLVGYYREVGDEEAEALWRERAEAHPPPPPAR